jgi:hypothetical protein
MVMASMTIAHITMNADLKGGSDVNCSNNSPQKERGGPGRTVRIDPAIPTKIIILPAITNIYPSPEK